MGSEDVLVEIQPRELQFLFEVKKQSSCCVHLENKSDQYVAFKVKTTSPKRYCVRPNVGVVLPRASRDFTVIMQSQKNAPRDLQIKDKFLVQTTVVPFGTADKDIDPAFFSKETGRYIEENKLRVVLVSVTQPQVEQPFNGVPCAKAIVEVPMPEEILDLDNLNEVPNVANEVPPMRSSYPPLRETPALSEISSPVKGSLTVPLDLLAPSKKAPASFSLSESAPCLKETPTVSVESHFSSTGSSTAFKESAPLEDTAAPREAVLPSDNESTAAPREVVMPSDNEFAAAPREAVMPSDNESTNAQILHQSHVTKDVQNLQSKFDTLEAKLEEAETLIVKLREKTRTTIQERDKLRKEMVLLKRAGTAQRSQAGFPLLFVFYMAVVGMSLGYLLHL